MPKAERPCLIVLTVAALLLCGCQRKTTGAKGVSSVAPAAAAHSATSAPTLTPRASPALTETPTPEVLFMDRSDEVLSKHVQKQPCMVAIIGDSLTDEKGPSGGLYISELARHLPKSSFHNFGRGGNMVNQMRRRFETDVFHPSHPTYTHVVVFGGVNDLYSDQTAGRTNELIQTDLGAMYQSARKRGAQVVAITVTPWGGFSRYFNARRGNNTLLLNQWIINQRQGMVDFVVDLHPLLSCGDSLCPRFAEPHKDGLHMGPKAHTVLAEALLEQAFAHCL